MSTHLDQRQRAMLAEMGVRVWSPMAQPDVPGPASAPAPVPSAATPAGAQRPSAMTHLDWATLQQTVAQCQACGLCAARHNTVFGVGAPAATGQAPQVDWLIVGEAPDENEDLQGEPFVGQAGQLLDNMLQAMGLARQAPPPSAGVYITKVLKCRPPGNRNPSPDEVAQCLPFLERQVALLQPKIILAMGRFAVQALLRDTMPAVDTVPLGKLRGQVHRYQGVPVVATCPPAYVLRNLPEKAKVWADLCLAMATLKG